MQTIDQGNKMPGENSVSYDLSAGDDLSFIDEFFCLLF